MLMYAITALWSPLLPHLYPKLILLVYRSPPPRLLLNPQSNSSLPLLIRHLQLPRRTFPHVTSVAEPVQPSWTHGDDMFFLSSLHARNRGVGEKGGIKIGL